MEGLAFMDDHGKTHNTRELLNADVVELTSGSVVGKVAEAIINTRTGTIEFLGIRPAQWHEPGLLLNTADILGFDETVLLIRDFALLVPMDEGKQEAHYETCSDLYRLTLIDVEGHVLGRPVGCVFNASGHIVALEAEKDLVVHFVSLGRIIAVGNRFVVADLKQQPGHSERAGLPTEHSAALKREGRAGEISVRLTKEEDAGDDNGRHGSIGAKYRERQVQLMLGKVSPIALNGKSGQPVISLGETITGRIINRLIDEDLLNDVFIALTVHHGHIPTDEPEINPE